MSALYGPWGMNLWPGGAPLADPDLLALGPARLIHDAGRDHDGSADLVLVIGDCGTVPAGALAHVVAALDRGEAIAVHGPDDAVVAVACASICALLGGGNA